MNELDAITYWHWWILGAVLVTLEIFAPGAFLLWMGVAAGVVGFVVLAVPDMRWEYQLLIFAVVSVASIALWKSWRSRHPEETDQPTLNRRGEQYVGRVFTLEQPIVNGVGKIRVDDSTWRAEGPDCPAGERVRVVGVDGTLLRVEPVADRPPAGEGG